MPAVQDHLRAYVEYLRDLGVHDLYRHGLPVEAESASISPREEQRLEIGLGSRAMAYDHPSESLQPAIFPPQTASSNPAGSPAALPGIAPREHPSEPVVPKPLSFNELAPLPQERVATAERPSALHAIRDYIGDCTRCPLAYAGRRKIVFGNGDPAARLMFVGEGPGADEDATGEPFVGKAGQLLNNMIQAMGLQREQVYVANIVKCRPPANGAPEPVEANTCSQFLVSQIDVVQPEVIVALGATAALYLLGVKQSLASLRGAWHTCRGAKLAVTYHPAFLLRDPRQKGEAWKDLQMVMKELGLERKVAADKA